MKIPKIKQPISAYGAFPLPLPNVDRAWFGKDKKPKEIEADIDGERCIIEIQDIKHIDFDWLDLIEFEVKISIGIDIPTFKKMLVKKYTNLIEKQRIALVSYKFIEKI